MVSFKGAQFPNDVIRYAHFFYVRYAVSYRDLEEFLEQRVIPVVYTTLNRSVVKYASAMEKGAQRHKEASSWKMPSRDIASQCPAR